MSTQWFAVTRQQSSLRPKRWQLCMSWKRWGRNTKEATRAKAVLQRWPSTGWWFSFLDGGLRSQSCHLHFPATVAWALFRPGNGTFEPLCTDPFSSTPELPDIMKPQESGSSSSEPALWKTSISCFAFCRQGAGLVYVSCVHSHPSKCVYLTNKALQFNYMSVCCSVQAANKTVSWDPSLKLVLEKKGGSSYMCSS